MAEWVRAPLACSVALGWRPDGAGRVRIPLQTTSPRNIGNSIYPALLVSFGGDTSLKAVGPFYLVSMPGPPMTLWPEQSRIVRTITHISDFDDGNI